MIDKIKNNKNFFQTVFIFVQVLIFYDIFEKNNLMPIGSLVKYVGELLIVFNSYFFIKKTIYKYKDIFYNKWLLVLFIFINLLISFFIGGKQIFMTKEIFEISFLSITTYFLLNILVFPIIYNYIYFLNNTCIINKKQKIEKKQLIIFSIIIFSICFVIWTVAAFSFYPGNMTSDSVDQICQALGVYKITNSHPAFNTILMRYILRIWKNPMAIIICDIAFFSIIISYIFTYLYKNGVKKVFLISATVLFVLAFNNMALIMIIWKDVPFTISLLWLTFELYKIQKEKEGYFKNVLNDIKLIICLLFVYFFRINGMIPYLISIVYLFYIMFKSENKKNILFVILVSFFSIWFVKNPVYKFYDIKTGSSSGAAASFATKGLGALAYYDADLTKEEKRDLSVLLPIKKLKKNYSAYNIDTYAFGQDAIGPGVEKLGVNKIYKIYITNIFKNPKILIRDRLDSNNLLWSYITPSDGFNSTYVQGIWFPSTYEKKFFGFKKNKEGYYISDSNNIRDLSNKWLDLSNNNPVIYICFWRPAVALSLLILLLYWMILNKIRLYAMFLPTLISVCFWVMLLSHQSYRYLWFIFVNTFIGYIIILSEKKAKRKKGDVSWKK